MENPATDLCFPSAFEFPRAEEGMDPVGHRMVVWLEITSRTPLYRRLSIKKASFRGIFCQEFIVDDRLIFYFYSCLH